MSSTTTALNFEDFWFEDAAARGKPAVVVLLLHGLFGSLKNNRTFAQGLGRKGLETLRRPFHIILPDLRAHGLSTKSGGRTDLLGAPYNTCRRCGRALAPP